MTGRFMLGYVDWRPKISLVLSEDERLEVSSLARSRTLPHAIVARARVVLWAAEGASNTEIRRPFAVDQSYVGEMAVPFPRTAAPGAV